MRGPYSVLMLKITIQDGIECHNYGFMDGFLCPECTHLTCWEDSGTHPDGETPLCDDCWKAAWKAKEFFEKEKA